MPAEKILSYCFVCQQDFTESLEAHVQSCGLGHQCTRPPKIGDARAVRHTEVFNGLCWEPLPNAADPIAIETQQDCAAPAPADPWKHRSQGMRCKTCIWFVPKMPEAKLGYDLGRCRRHAPTMNGFPAVFVNDWCGDHRIDENKL